jgi:hypothetical protein
VAKVTRRCVEEKFAVRFDGPPSRKKGGGKIEGRVSGVFIRSGRPALASIALACVARVNGSVPAC